LVSRKRRMLLLLLKRAILREDRYSTKSLRYLSSTSLLVRSSEWRCQTNNPRMTAMLFSPIGCARRVFEQDGSRVAACGERAVDE